MTPERRVELTGDPQIARLLERIRELEKAIEKAVADMDSERQWVDEIAVESIREELQAVLVKRGEA